MHKENMLNLVGRDKNLFLSSEDNLIKCQYGISQKILYVNANVSCRQENKDLIRYHIESIRGVERHEQDEEDQFI